MDRIELFKIFKYLSLVHNAMMRQTSHCFWRPESPVLTAIVAKMTNCRHFRRL